MSNRHYAATAAGLAVAFSAALAGFAPAARANDRDPRATPVPAAACAEIFHAPGITPWKSGGWFGLYTGGAYVHLRCALPLNNVDLGGTTDDNDISKFRVHYRDGDGLGTTARVEVDLKRSVVNVGGLPGGHGRMRMEIEHRRHGRDDRHQGHQGVPARPRGRGVLLFRGAPRDQRRHLPGRVLRHHLPVGAGVANCR